MNNNCTNFNRESGEYYDSVVGLSTIASLQINSNQILQLIPFVLYFFGYDLIESNVLKGQ